MGLFKDTKHTLNATPEAINQASQLQHDAVAAQGAAQQPVDLNDPVWAPIDGITLDKYAQITAAMARQNLGTPDQAEAWLETQGVTRGTWPGVNVGWVNRMAINEAVRTRYGVMYSQS